MIGGPPQDRSHRGPGIPPVIAKTARLGEHVTVDAGKARATEVRERAWLMHLVHVGHDAIIGEGAELAVGCIVSGHVEIGDDVRAGVGAMFKPFVKVGQGSRIGMGSVVLEDVPALECWAGNPARKLYDLCRGGCFRRVPAPGRCSGCEFARGLVPVYIPFK